MLNFIIERLGETSTWRGVVSVLTGVGIKIRPDLSEYIISIGLSLIGIVNIFRKEKGAPADSVPAQKP